MGLLLLGCLVGCTDITRLAHVGFEADIHPPPCKLLKQKCGVGGSVKENQRKKVTLKKRRNMKSLLIKDTTVSERAQIVRESLGADSDCEGVDLSDMYDDYIYGLKELADINREFSEKHAGTIVAGELTKPSGCAHHNG